jgi:hypothetical protein
VLKDLSASIKNKEEDVKNVVEKIFVKHLYVKLVNIKNITDIVYHVA